MSIQRKALPIIEVKNLVKNYQVFEKEPGFTNSLKSLFSRKYKEVKAVRDVSFQIEEGELVGFIGPNGAGKTTTLKCLSGLLYPTSGQISVLDHQPWRRQETFLKNIAFVMGQKNQLWWELPPMESFLLNREIYEIPAADFTKTLNNLVKLLEVSDLIYTPVKKLSLGQRMKCELIASLVHNPKVLYLDEPTIGLDVVMQNRLREFIGEYNREFGATIILTSHYMGDVQALAKRVIVIASGKIIFDGQLEKLVEKHAPYKLISLVLKKEIDKSKLNSFGEIKLFDFPRVTFKVSAKGTKQDAARMLKELPVDDFNIEDADIEEVIRDIFESEEGP
ncbi:ABC transporter ATP-binding protein [Candidatus Curtissbacteria bacterium]|nr:ABC transporter ATP-binding protein [Candidatus Curtissbacteria bacterium]